MPNSNAMKEAIQSVVREMMEKVLHRVLVEDPFIPEKHKAEKPLYAALVPDEIFKGSHFERRFVTPFGKAWQRLAVIAAQHGLGYGESDRVVQGIVKEGRLRRITETLNHLEHRLQGVPKILPKWETELAYVLDGGGEAIPVTVVCDVYAQNLDGRCYAFELKAPLPNSDQTKVSKEKLLKLYAMEPRQVDEAYFALPYNPYGRRENYQWSFPARWFDMQNDPVILIGDEFWEKIGGIGTYQAFIQAIDELGREYKGRIYTEFLGIRPPDMR